MDTSRSGERQWIRDVRAILARWQDEGHPDDCKSQESVHFGQSICDGDIETRKLLMDNSDYGNVHLIQERGRQRYRFYRLDRQDLEAKRNRRGSCHVTSEKPAMKIPGQTTKNSKAIELTDPIFHTPEPHRDSGSTWFEDN